MKKTILAAMIMALVGCGDDTDVVKKAYISASDHYTYDSVLSNRPVCTNTTWSAFEDNNVKHIKYVCDLAQGSTFPVYSESDKNALARKAKKEFIDNKLKEHEQFLESVNNEINRASAFVGKHWDEVEINQFINKEDKNNIYYWKFEDIKMSTIIDEYVMTTDEGRAYNEAMRKYARLKILSNVDVAEEKRKLASTIIPLYIDEIKSLLKVREDIFIANQKTFPKEGIDYVNKKVNDYVDTHPTNMKEQIVWIQNQLNKKYEINDISKRITWSTGETTKENLCLKDIVYSVAYHITDIDRYNELTAMNKISECE